MISPFSSDYEDRALLSDISPLQVAVYLRATGWEERSQDDRVAIWTLLPADAEPDDYYEVLLPLRPDFRDFAPRMAELFCTLEQAERRDRDAILDSLVMTGADVVNLRLIGDRVSHGSLPFSDAVLLTQRAYDLMQAAACSVVAPRAVYSNRRPDRVRQYLDSLRVGPTRRGSYVVTIQSPVEPQFDVVDPEQSAEPFERRVLRRMFNGIQALREAAVTAASHNSAEAFAKEVINGVSANLCEAVADLASVGGEGLEISCRWSPSRRLPEELPTHLFVSKDVVPYVQAAARSFRANAAIEDVEVRGFVERVSRRRGVASGKVTIVGDVDGHPRRIEATLSGDVYQLAVQAHKEEKSILCYGTVERRSLRYLLNSPHGFHMED